MPTFLMGAIGGIGNAIGGIASALGSVVSTIGGILQTAAKLVMGAVQSIASGLKAVGGLLMRGAMAFFGVMMKATQGAMAYAKSVNDLRLSTGMNMKEASSTSMKFGACLVFQRKCWDKRVATSITASLKCAARHGAWMRTTRFRLTARHAVSATA